MLKQALFTFKIRVPTDEELKTCTRLSITNDTPWDPRLYTEDIDAFKLAPDMPTNNEKTHNQVQYDHIEEPQEGPSQITQESSFENTDNIINEEMNEDKISFKDFLKN